MNDLERRLSKLSPAQRELFKKRLAENSRITLEPIAVVGMACRFPGADNIDQYWDLICRGGNATKLIPGDRFPVDQLYDEDYEAAGKMISKWACLRTDLGEFDPKFFGIAPREATRMDPQQRLLLEVAWEAMEHAGIPPEKLSESPTGVFMGVSQVDYIKLAGQFDDFLEMIDAHTGTGNSLSICANRLSYVFNFSGPSASIDTACSSALVALHQAVQSLRARECDAALAGAVNVCITPDSMISLSRARMVSPTGQCRPFHEDADGYVRGEGGGVVVLKRLSDAVEAGDRVLAVLRHTAVNHGGRTSGITAPNGSAQVQVIRKALAGGGVKPEEIGYVEAHGTGTPLGDPIEVDALGEVYPSRSADEKPVYLTSVKANIGHLEIAAGIAGLIKAILVLRKGHVPLQPGLDKVNPRVITKGTRLKIPTESVTLPDDQSRRLAGVSSFGFGGTNGHAVIEAVAEVQQAEDGQTETADHERPFHVLALSAQSDKSLKLLAKAYQDFVTAIDPEKIGDLCHAAANTRTHHPKRAVIRIENASDPSSRAQLIEDLGKLAEGKTSVNSRKGNIKFRGRGRYGFLFTGQGSQLPGMARELYDTHPVFRETMDECQEVFLKERGESLLEVVFDPDGAEKLNETSWTQPALFAVEISLAKLWKSWGVEPSVVMGHSVGEYVAACVAGVFSIEDGLRLIAKRGELMGRLPEGGSMAVAFCKAEKLEPLLASFDGKLEVAAHNGPENTTVSGDAKALEQFIVQCESSDISCQRLSVSHAFHSYLMEPMLDEFEEFAAGIDMSSPKLPLVSNVYGELIEQKVSTPGYWKEHIRAAVQFAAGIDIMAGEDLDALIEIGPTPALLGMAKRCRPKWSIPAVASLRKGIPDISAMLQGLTDFYLAGGTVNWAGFDGPWQFDRIDLPLYPFDHQNYWLEPASKRRLDEVFGLDIVHPMLGKRIAAAETTIFQAQMRSDSPVSIKDHVVQGSVIIPGSGYTEMGFAAAEHLFGKGSHHVEDLTFQQALFLSEETKLVQMVVSPPSGSRYPFRIYSRPLSGDDAVGWELNATGTIVRGSQEASRSGPPQIDLKQIEEDVLRERDHDDFYQIMSDRNLDYGPTYRIMDGLNQTADGAVAPMRFHDDVVQLLKNYTIPPAVGDGAMHCAGGAVPLQADGSFTPYTYLPATIKSVKVFAPLSDGLDLGGVIAVSKRTSNDGSESPELVTADVFLTNTDGHCLVQYEGVTLRRLGKAVEEDEHSNPQQWLYEWGWEENNELTGSASEDENADNEEQSKRSDRAGETVVVLADKQGVGMGLANKLAADCGRVITVSPADKFAHVQSDGDTQSTEHFDVNPADDDDFSRLIASLNLKAKAPLRVVHAWSIDVENPVGDGMAQINRSRELSAWSSLSLYRHISAANLGINPTFLLVTSGGQIIDESHPVSILQQEMIGIGRAATLEFGGFTTRLIDLDPNDEISQSAERLEQELFLDTEETQVAWRDGKRLCGRIRRLKDLDEQSDAAIIPTGSPYRLTIANDNTIEGLRYKPFRREKPAPGEVEIQVSATGLNFSDVLKSLGLYPGITDDVVPVGIECAGTISAVGDGVTDLHVGDDVMGIVPYGFGSHCVTARHAVVRKPASLDYEEGATIPIAFMTAHHCLVDVGRLRKGERVLIHAGAGGVGLAAIQIAEAIGAEIFATAGSDVKREYLQAIGVDHVMNSRDVEFSEQIEKITEGKGVDVVLNSLPGDAIDHSLAVLAEYGRFVEIGKVDIYQNKMIGLLPFQRNLSYAAVDLDRMFRKRPEESQQLLAAVMEKFDEGTYQPPHVTVFDSEQVVDAFRYMSRRQNIGKIVVSSASVETVEEEPEEKIQMEAMVHSDHTYLVTGGLGGLGRKVASWLAKHGAGAIVLTSRREPSEEIQEEMRRWSSQFPATQFVAMPGDVSDANSLQQLLAKIDKELPPLRGVIHAAGAVENQFMTEMDKETYERNTKAKIEGGWNLHTATLNRELDFMVLFSSVSTIVGTIQQSAYGAANAFLDGLAHYRRSQNLPVTAINWGPWADVGMAAESGNDLDSRGNLALPVQPSLDLMGELICSDTRQATVMIVQWPKFIRAYEALRRSGIAPPMFNDFKVAKADDENAKAEARAFHAKLMSLELEDRETELQSYLSNQIAQIMGLEPDDLDVNQSLNTMGLDSLMAIELANKLQMTLQVALPMSIFIENPSVASLAKQSAIAMDGNQEGKDAEDALEETDSGDRSDAEAVAAQTD